MEELIDSKALIKKFYKYFEEYKRRDIRKTINEGLPYLKVDFFELSEFDFELGDTILANPIECIAIMEETLKQFFESDDDIKPLKIRFITLPVTEKIMIRDIRSDKLGKLVILEGLVRRKTDVRPRMKYIEYLCANPSCNFSEDKIRVPQFEEKAQVLKMCPKCKSGVEVVSKILLDSQNLVLEEIPEHLKNSSEQPKRIKVLLQEDLVSPFKDSKTNPGSRVYVIGIVKEIPILTQAGAESINYDLVIEGNYIDMTEDDYSDIIIEPEEEEKIKEIAAREDAIDVLVRNTAPAIYGYTRIKEAILLQLFGGAGGDKGGGIKTRANIHMLLLGDPGAAKSQLLKSASKIAPKSMFVSGKSATGAGLTATVVKDEMTKGWALEAGAMVLANGGMCAIDELDKMSDEDTSTMHEALEQQTISIAKANIRATLRCETTVLGAANPKYGRFDPYGDIMKQIDFPPALVSRFDLIFIVRDIPDKKKDTLIAEHILQAHRDNKKTETELSSDFMKKYIAYAKQIRPVLTQAAIEKIRDFYVSIRNAAGQDEEATKSVPITARQLEAIVRLAEASARIKLDKKVRACHAEHAIDMLMYCLQKIGIDPKTGQMDIDKITTGITQSSRNEYKLVRQIIDNLEVNTPEINIADIISEGKKMTLKEVDIVKTLDKLKQEGAIFEPRKGIYKKL